MMRQDAAAGRLVTVRVCLLFAATILSTATVGAADDLAWLDAYNEVWNSPSDNHHGSMPLGNGDIAINAWVARDGDLQCYIAKTDAWDDNARLVKVGKVRVRLHPNLLAGATSFRQTLSLRDGALKIEAGEGARRATVQVWVDANRPVVHVTAESAVPTEAVAGFEIWRTRREELAELQCSDVMNAPGKPGGKYAPTFIEPDTILNARSGRVGWYHHNIKSVGPELLAKIQGLTGFPQADPLLHRTFGAVVTSDRGERLDDRRLRSPSSNSHRLSVYVVTRHPATPKQWLAAIDDTIRRVELVDFAARRQAHDHWWREFWSRSWIRAATDPSAPAGASAVSAVPANHHPVRIGMDQQESNRFSGELGRVSVFGRVLSGAEIASLAALDRGRVAAAGEGVLFSGIGGKPRSLAGSTSWDFSAGVSVEAWIKPERLPGGGARIVDRITPGGSDGFLFDTFPGNSLRWICGETILQSEAAAPAGRWTHVAAVAEPAAAECRLYVDGRRVQGNVGEAVRDEAQLVSRKYHLQRFVTACAGRGAYPIKFNGSLFTVPPGPTEADPDYRRWGPGYWWQNTRLPYISLCTSGDFDLLKPLFHMYADELLPLCKFRTQRYLGHGGAYYPECIVFWGPVFSETYGWTPFEQRVDKLQESGWHKWEWVGGLELCWMMLDRYEHTLDRDFLRRTAIPFCREILTFFDEHYRTNAQGTLVMHPAQALETWWDCTNPMPELAGCTAVADRLMALPDDVAHSDASEADRQLWRRLRRKLPPLPLRDVAGKKALAPAEKFANKPNSENPELYAVFPFRLIALNRPNAALGTVALDNRWDRGDRGWRQDDIFMAYLGRTTDAKKNLVGRARHYDPAERFPAFWGPNYDWTPDQDHGGVLMKALQAMLMQTDGRQILLLPAWPAEWDCQFKLHAPYQTIVEGKVRGGCVTDLKVTPPDRKRDVLVMSPRRPSAAPPSTQPKTTGR